METLDILETLGGSAKAFFKQHLDIKENLVRTAEYEKILANNQNYKTKVFYKGFFDKLNSPFDYHTFRFLVLNNSIYKRELNHTAFIFGKDWNSNYELSYHIINIFNVYCGFVAEAVIKKAIEERGFKTKTSTYLDTKRKTDILVDNKVYIQLKNISFLLDSGCEGRISSYKDYEYLRFLFYRVSENAIIDIYKIDSEALPQIVALNGFSALTAEVVPFEKAIEAIDKAKKAKKAAKIA